MYCLDVRYQTSTPWDCNPEHSRGDKQLGPLDANILS